MGELLAHPQLSIARAAAAAAKRTAPRRLPRAAELALTIAGAAVAGAVAWHYLRESYYTYVPPRVCAAP